MSDNHDDHDDPYNPDMADVPDDHPKGRGEGAKSLFPEGLRKAIASGANVLFASEEGGKKSLGELRLPKEAIQFIYGQAERGRKDLFRAARHEMRRMLSSVDMRGELRRALVGLKVQVKAEITFTEDATEVKVTSPTVDPRNPGKPQDSVPKKRRRTGAGSNPT